MLIDKGKKVIADPLICDITTNNDQYIIKALNRLCSHVNLIFTAGTINSDLKMFRDQCTKINNFIG